MISEMQNFMQKHHKWLFSILLFVIIIAFVFSIGAAPSIGKKQRKQMMFFGQDLSNAHEMREITNDVIYSNILEFQDANLGRDSLNFAVLKRIVSLDIADKFQMPVPSEAALQRYMKTLPAFVDENGKFSTDRYNAIVEMFLRNGASKERLTRILCENHKIHAVEQAIAGDGAVFDKIIADTYNKLNTEYDFIVATLNNSGSYVGDEISDDEVNKIYHDRPDRYTKPQMHAVSMIKFDVSEYEHLISEPTDEVLRDFFSANKDHFSVNSAFDDVREHVREAYIKSEAMKLAHAASEKFVSELYREGIKLNSGEFTEKLSAFGVQKEKIALYSKKKLPSVNGINPAYLSAVCDLDDGRYYSDPYPTTFGSVVLLLEYKKNARPLTLDEAQVMIKDQIIRTRRLDAFAKEIEDIRTSISSALDSDESLDDVLSRYGVQYEKYSGISINNSDDKGIDVGLKHAIISLGEKERIKLSPVSDEEIVMFIVTARHAPENSDRDKQQLSTIETNLKNIHKHSFLMDFFTEQILPAVKKFSPENI